VIERPAPFREHVTESAAAELSTHHSSEAIEFPEEIEIPLPAEDAADGHGGAMQVSRSDSTAALLADGPRITDVPRITEVVEDVESHALETVDEAAAVPSLRDLQLKLRFHRADFYLVAAIAVSTFAMVWVLSATPAPGAHRKPRLRPWERALIS